MGGGNRTHKFNGDKIKKKKCRNNYKIKYQNRGKGQNRYPLTNKYMTAHFPGLEQTLQ